MNHAGIDLGYLDKSEDWSERDELRGVDVVFIATKPQTKDKKSSQVVVGWYRNATVLHKFVKRRPFEKGGSTYYVCKTPADRAFFLPEKYRQFGVPFAWAGHPGFPGQSNVWYPSKNWDKKEVRDFVKSLQNYIDAEELKHAVCVKDRDGYTGDRKRNREPDTEHNQSVEVEAVQTVFTYFRRQGYIVKSVESENKGWDLEASKNGETLKLEVKGSAAGNIFFELTPNEYAQLQAHPQEFRLCMVCNALDSQPSLTVLLPQKKADGWQLACENGKLLVPLTEKIAAVGRAQPS